ncbi:Eco57I restriction-modification methylase domain-containing protein [Novosphingobium resinovorum]|uniref:site-specific DNA-methyltransferase (adenine-specific) n=1 Tax=Novosphingobium resinovorum TaxID=158500 RepID=A0A1D8A2J6_9SPHN|nr:N-6 DNA methylase [Novosphingobium resinovorum]AOR76361.1 type II DNA modification enzyme [Novosphingobium resinovorum]
MSRAAKRSADLGLAAITIEGGLISPDQVQAIASAAPDAKMAADYGCPKGTNLRDEITRYFRIAQAHWQTFNRLADPTTTQTATFAKGLLEQAFGFALTGPHVHHREDRRFTIAWEAKDGRVPIVVAPPAPLVKGVPGDGFARALPEFGDDESGRIHRRSPTVLLQDWLNANDAALWGLVFAGDRLRLMRDNASLTRPAWIEVDLANIFRDDMFADFTALWLLIHASRFGAEGAAQSDSSLERWREAGMRAGTAARDRLRVNVEDALLVLGQGLLDANPAVRARLDSNDLPLPHLFEQMLRVIYRMIFLAVAEDRDLLHPSATPKATRDLYAANYGFAHLRDRSVKRHAHDHHHDAWEGAKVVFRALVQGEPRLGLPALGGLFDQGLTPDLDTVQIPNRAFLTAAYKLAWLIDDSRRVRINWRDMATEELGSVYEGLLELVPMREDEGHTFSFAGGAEARGNARKTSGSYYTPDSLVQCLLDSALDPVLDRAEAEGGVDAILDLNIIDPACGSGHFLLGAARRVANRVAQLRNPDAPDYNAAMRDAVRNCIHGVDRNPMAVELAKVALWIETVEPGKPLGFLDANLQCGDSLLGVFDLAALEEGIPDDAYNPLTGDDKETAKHFTKRNKAEKVGQGMFDFGLGGGGLPPARLAAQMDDLRHLPEDTVAQIKAKREKFLAWANDPQRYATKVACDLYVAAFLLPKTGGVPISSGNAMIPTTGHLRTRMGGGNIYCPLEGAAVNAAEFARAFHWPLAFPEVIIARGGFDVVLGNPPWEVVQLSEGEYFSSRIPEIAIMKGIKRKRAIASLESEQPDVFAKFVTDKRVFDAVNEFSRASGRFNFTARGKINTYSLFAEHFLNLTRRSGQAGLIVPTGIATDATTAPFFSHLVSSQRLKALFSFENEEMIFPGVHHATKFCLLAYREASPTPSEFVFFARQVDHLEHTERRFTLSPDQIERINPNTKTAPIFRTLHDAQLTAKIYDRVPVLFEEETRLSSIKAQLVQNFFSGSNSKDQIIFEAGSIAREEDRVPVYRGSMVWHFNHRAATFDQSLQEFRELTEQELEDPSFQISSDKYVKRSDLKARYALRNWGRGWFAGWRDITSSTNERTVVSCIAPAAAADDTFSLILVENGAKEAILLCSALNSLVVDFCAQQKVGGSHIRKYTLQQFPVLPPSAYSMEDLAFIVPRVLELTYTSHSMASFARDLGYDAPPFAWDDDRRGQLRAELDAWYALAYGLTRDELRYVLAPKDVMGPNYPSETFRVLQNNEIRKYGEYRTQRLVLAAYDKLASAAPDVSSVADRAWDHRVDAAIDVRHIFAAIMKKTVGPVAPLDVWLAALFAAKPHLLMHHLTLEMQAQWRRLVGDQVNLQATPNVAAFSAATPQAFHDAVAQLRAERSIHYNVQSRMWDRGAEIYHYAPLAWADGRAAFVLHAIRSIVIQNAVAALPQEEREWIAAAA